MSEILTVTGSPKYHFAFSFDNLGYASGDGQWYINGAPVTTTGNGGGTPGVPLTANCGGTGIGIDGSKNEWPYPSWIDEVHMAHTVRTASWVLAEYNNQFSPSTFWKAVGNVNFSPSWAAINGAILQMEQ